MIRLLLLALALTGTAPAYAQAEQLRGNELAFLNAAELCVRATSGGGVDRAMIAQAGYGDVFAGEIDHNPVWQLRSPAQPFTVRVETYRFMGPQNCVVAAKFEQQAEFEALRQSLIARMGRKPDSMQMEDMRETRWVFPEKDVDLWMMPAHELCGEDCPRLTVTVHPREK